MAQYQVGQELTHQQTGHKIVWTGQQWVDARSPEAGRAHAQANPLQPGALARVGRGMMDVGSGVRQLLPEAIGGMTPEREQQERDDIARYERGAGPGTDWLRIGGQAAATSPLMLIPGMGATGLLGRSAAGVASGSAAGASLFADEPNERLQNAMMGGLFGGVAAAAIPPVATLAAKTVTGAARGVSRAFNALKPGARAEVTANLVSAAERAGVSLDDLGSAARKALENDAAKAFRAGSLDADALIRKAKAEKFGFVDDAAPTLGQVTRNARQFSDEVNLAKSDAVGAPLDARFTAQRARANAVLDETGKRIGATVDETADSAGEVIEKAAQKRAQEWQTRVKAKYDAARASAPDTLLPGERLRDSVADVLKERRNSIPADVRRRISELSKDGIDPVELENLDKLVSEYYGADRATNSALELLKTRVRGLMDEAGEEFGGAYKEAVKEAADRFKAIGDWKGLTGKLVSGSFDPEKVAPRLMSGSVRQIERLRNFVSESNPEAWQKVGGAVWNDIVDRSMPSGNFSQAAYNRVIKRIGQRRLSLIYGDDVARQMKAFGEVAQDLFGFPSGHRVNTSNSAVVGANMLGRVMGSLTDAVPGGRLITPLLDSGALAASKNAQMRLVAQAMSGAPSGPPLTQLSPAIEGLLSQGARLSPVAGLLSNQRRQ